MVHRVAVLLLTLAGALTVVPATSATAEPAPGSAPAAQASVSQRAAARYAPLDRRGPRLSVPGSKLRSSLQCHGSPRSAKLPVLLSPATSVTPEENYSWNYEKAFTAQGRYWCAVTVPFHTFGDIQTAGQYLVHAIRTMHARTHRRIAVLGHSQGGMSPRWALRFWPDTRGMVSDLIGMAPSNHGTDSIKDCIVGVTSCTPAVWQQRSEARFMKALNSRAETFRDISYTSITTRRDEVVTPMNSAFLHTGRGRIRNVPVQDICPTDPYEHNLVGTVDPVAYALVMDALNHHGPADPARIDRAVCGRLYMPYVDPASLDNTPAIFGAGNTLNVLLPFVNTTGAPVVPREPQVRCYAFASGC